MITGIFLNKLQKQKINKTYIKLVKTKKQKIMNQGQDIFENNHNNLGANMQNNFYHFLEK